jgi:hypothetical protein
MSVVMLIEAINAILLFSGSADSSLILTKKSYQLNKKSDSTEESTKESHGTAGAANTPSTLTNLELRTIIVPKIISMTTEIVLATTFEVSIPM